MRFYIFSLGLLLAACFFLAPQQASAQTPNTYTYSTIDFDDATGTILATGHTQADYQTGAYYQQTGAGLKIVDAANGNQLAIQQKQVSGLTADVSAQTDAYADQEYKVLTGHYLLATYYVYNYYSQGQYRTGYYDPYNYSYYEGQNISSYNDYTFYGPGPVIVSQYTSNKTLGQTKKTVKVPTPHHLLVMNDFFEQSDCGGAGIKRILHYKLVDVNNKGVGKASMIENTGGAINDSCSGLTVTTTSGCSPIVDKTSLFSDTLGTGCPAPGVTNCGFDINPDLWQWCPPNGGAPVTVAKVKYNVRFTQIKVNDSASGYVGGTKFFADGTMQGP
ncbi:MAG TPA: hypothetical protein VF723_11170 [Pyrinomonadaceae bacterium]|jgi:hypothetical protein